MENAMSAVSEGRGADEPLLLQLEAADEELQQRMRPRLGSAAREAVLSRLPANFEGRRRADELGERLDSLAVKARQLARFGRAQQGIDEAAAALDGRLDACRRLNDAAPREQLDALTKLSIKLKDDLTAPTAALLDSAAQLHGELALNERTVEAVERGRAVERRIQTFVAEGEAALEAERALASAEHWPMLAHQQLLRLRTELTSARGKLADRAETTSAGGRVTNTLNSLQLVESQISEKLEADEQWRSTLQVVDLELSELNKLKNEALLLIQSSSSLPADWNSILSTLGSQSSQEQTVMLSEKIAVLANSATNDWQHKFEADDRKEQLQSLTSELDSLAHRFQTLVLLDENFTEKLDEFAKTTEHLSSGCSEETVVESEEALHLLLKTLQATDENTTAEIDALSAELDHFEPVLRFNVCKNKKEQCLRSAIEQYNNVKSVELEVSAEIEHYLAIKDEFEDTYESFKPINMKAEKSLELFNPFAESVDIAESIAESYVQLRTKKEELMNSVSAKTFKHFNSAEAVNGLQNRLEDLTESIAVKVEKLGELSRSGAEVKQKLDNYDKILAEVEQKFSSPIIISSTSSAENRYEATIEFVSSLQQEFFDLDNLLLEIVSECQQFAGQSFDQIDLRRASLDERISRVKDYLEISRRQRTDYLEIMEKIDVLKTRLEKATNGGMKLGKKKKRKAAQTVTETFETLLKSSVDANAEIAKLMNKKETSKVLAEKLAAVSNEGQIATEEVAKSLNSLKDFSQEVSSRLKVTSVEAVNKFGTMENDFAQILSAFGKVEQVRTFEKGIREEQLNFIKRSLSKLKLEEFAKRLDSLTKFLQGKLPQEQRGKLTTIQAQLKQCQSRHDDLRAENLDLLSKFGRSIELIAMFDHRFSEGRLKISEHQSRERMSLAEAKEYTAQLQSFLQFFVTRANCDFESLDGLSHFESVNANSARLRHEYEKIAAEMQAAVCAVLEEIEAEEKLEQLFLGLGTKLDWLREKLKSIDVEVCQNRRRIEQKRTELQRLHLIFSTKFKSDYESFMRASNLRFLLPFTEWKSVANYGNLLVDYQKAMKFCKGLLRRKVKIANEKLEPTECYYWQRRLYDALPLQMMFASFLGITLALPQFTEPVTDEVVQVLSQTLL